MYLTNFKVSAFALLFSMTLIFGAAHYAPTAADACVNCATLAPVPTLEAAPAFDELVDPVITEGLAMC